MVDNLGNFYTLEKYRTFLKKLRDKDIIDKFVDYSDDDKFKFEVTLSVDEAKKSKEKIFSDLGLVGKFTENLTCIGENNDIKDDFKSAEDIFNAYYKIKITYLKKRLVSETTRLEKEAQDLEEAVRFIGEVIKDTINMKAKKADIEALMKKKKYVNIDKLISMPLYSITEDKAKEFKKKWDEKIKELEAYKLETPESIWKKDLADLEKAIKK
jgi:DNA topoisomerase-2